MATVWVVTSGEYSDYGINAIFSTKELAEDFVLRSNAGVQYDGDKKSAREWELDGMAGCFAQGVWTTHIEKDSGRVSGPFGYWKTVKPGYTRVEDMANRFYVQSAVSADHSVKLAVEARQAWLREQVEVKP